MLKKKCICGLISAIIMLCLPLLTVTFLNNENGLAVFMLLIYVVNPITVMGIGIYSGKQINTMRLQPILLTFLFIAGSLIFWKLNTPKTLTYAAIYLIIGIVVMQMTSVIQSMKR